MTWDRSELNRSSKVLLDSDRAQDPAEADGILRALALQLDIGRGLEGDPAAQAAVITILNTAPRAFPGSDDSGLLVRLHEDPMMSVGWARGRRLNEIAQEFGGTIVDRIRDVPTIRVGDAPEQGSVSIRPTWSGWTAGVVLEDADRLDEDAMPLAGVLGGALAVSEVFQHSLGSTLAGRRSFGISLWRPDIDWRSADTGPRVRWLPREVWILGLGHLGQGFAWSLGFLPLRDPANLTIHVMDTDEIEPANHSTGMLVLKGDRGLKTRLVSERLEALGIGTRIVERRFDENFRVQRNEPGLALAGFDDPHPRRLLEGAGFDYVVDVGLGGGVPSYLDMMIHTFPSGLAAVDAFRLASPGSSNPPPPYAREIERRVQEGDPDAGCGVVEAFGASVGASFVGGVAGTLAVADVLRLLHEGSRYTVLALDLREPGPADVEAFEDEPPRLPFINAE